jgi:adenine-specific DNA-methyltransferase
MNARYASPDGDSQLWTPGDITGPGADTHRGQVYGIQSPFTGEMEYPPDGRCWAAERARIKAMAEAWGSEYFSKQLTD